LDARVSQGFRACLPQVQGQCGTGPGWGARRGSPRDRHRSGKPTISCFS